MIDDQYQPNLVDTTDCLEAVGVFRTYKNLFFIIVILSMIVLQAAFWLYHTGNIARAGNDIAAAVHPSLDEPLAQPADTNEPDTAMTQQPQAEPDQIDSAARDVVAADANEPNQLAQQPSQRRPINIKLTKAQIEWTIRVANFTLFASAMLFTLTLLFILKTSLLGRIGGINHIARGFFLALIALFFILPWQLYFPGILPGTIFTADELFTRTENLQQNETSNMVLFYLRFSGIWLVAFIFLVKAQLRTCRWTRTMHKRLDVV